MDLLFSLIIFLVVTLVFIFIVTIFVAVVGALFALIVSKDEHRAENSINAVLSSFVFGVVFGIGLLFSYFFACGTQTDFGFGDFRFVRLYNCSLESIDSGDFCLKVDNGLLQVDNLTEVCQVDSLFFAKQKGDSAYYALDLVNGKMFPDSLCTVKPDLVDVERFYYKKQAEITKNTRSWGTFLSVVLGLLCAYICFFSLRKSKDGLVARFKRTPIIRRLFV
ncbi:MAG: hypothetical protein K6G31_00790 [Paludibacteraceae bacterium]|nr:hypothetical protein [Paludibacteraceae bacterium]MBR6043672.1 hypothetical protein [Paludibacteraceae bacterium]MCR5567792.1 hypothetical protein [Paludibacteraceae bacterium]